MAIIPNKEQRVGVFIDIQNLYHSAKHLYKARVNFAKVLEEAVGRVNPIYVVVQIVDADGTQYLQVAKGGVFSYYEFPWPMDDRLTDEKWREMLGGSSTPKLPEWTATFAAP